VSEKYCPLIYPVSERDLRCSNCLEELCGIWDERRKGCGFIPWIPAEIYDREYFVPTTPHFILTKPKEKGGKFPSGSGPQ